MDNFNGYHSIPANDRLWQWRDEARGRESEMKYVRITITAVLVLAIVAFAISFVMPMLQQHYYTL